MTIINIAYETESGMYDEDSYFDLEEEKDDIINFFDSLWYDELIDIQFNDKSVNYTHDGKKFYDMLVKKAKEINDDISVNIYGIVYS
jgi:hypothetical protein